ncbi:Hypothetical protein R9X50_00343200 [Acrodontium crateriforme]|uniref:Uncharacterized protein n=1 Tax=Acrodontium crateriforme TaxID=150365 RepID=A0AAQ3M915_9PEZI|nr:Hypothetical protein R9X50_00343200 [Acrodontium crateriforme]
MKASFTLAAAAGLSVANAQYFGLMAARSASPIHFQSIQANGQALWIGKPSAHYCPPEVQTQGDCPNTTDTNFSAGQGELIMGVAVPGGQGVYVDAVSGAIGYNKAHSSSIPQGAITDGWSKTNTNNGYDILSWRDGLLACPADGENGPYQIFAYLPTASYPPNCLGFDAIATNETEPAAWEYI